MKNITKNVNLSILVLASMSFQMINSKQLKNKKHFLMDDIFTLDSFDDMFDQMKQQLKEVRENLINLEKHSESTQKAIESNKNLSKIKFDTSADDNNVFIKFDINNLNKDSVDIQSDENKIVGTIKTNDGKVEFVIQNDYLEVSKSIEVKEESKNTDNKDKSEKAQTFMHFGSFSKMHEKLPGAVDLSSIKADIKDNQLTITLDKKKQKKVHVNITK